MNRFFVNGPLQEDALARITGEDARHIRLVLRLKPGEAVSLSDGERVFYGTLEEVGEDAVSVRVMYEEHGDAELSTPITLYQGIPKGDKMEWVLQKAVELGAARIVPVSTERTVVRLDEKKAASRQKRWQSIAESAAAQSHRRVVPEVAPVMTFAQALADAQSLKHRLFPYEKAEGIAASRTVVAEAERATAAGFVHITLGKRILRTETAGLAALSVLSFLLEEES